MARHATESRTYGVGRQFTFHGKFRSKLLARKREKEIPGSFIREKGGYHFVLKPRRGKANRARVANPKGVLIYPKITRIEGTKGARSQFPGERFFHNFKRPYPKMYGLPDGSLLITSK